MYFISTIRIAGCVVDDCRTIYFTSSYGDAYQNVLQNAVDMFEDGYYQYAVITFINEGEFYPSKSEQQWFQFKRLTDDVFEVTSNDYEIVTIDKPYELKEYRPYIIG